MNRSRVQERELGVIRDRWFIRMCIRWLIMRNKMIVGLVNSKIIKFRRNNPVS